MTSDFYYQGRSDCLQKLPANPLGAQTPKEHNDYMNGYNSVREMMQRGLHRSLEKSIRSFNEIIILSKQPTPLEKICIQGLDVCLGVIRKEKCFKVSLTDAEKFFMTSFGTLYSLNPEEAIDYAGKYNTAQLRKTNSEDLAKSAGKLISLIGKSEEKQRGTSFPEISDFFTNVLLNTISKGNYTSGIILPDEFYLKFVQALAMENHPSLARFKASAFNETQKALVNPNKRKVKQIVEIGSKFKYSISLEQAEQCK